VLIPLAKSRSLLELVPASTKAPNGRRVLSIVLIALSIALMFLMGLAIGVARNFDTYARKWIVNALETRYQSSVEMGDFHATMTPLPQATITNLKLRLGNRTDVPPFVSIRRLTVEGNLRALLGKPVHIHKVTLEGLEITISPGDRERMRLRTSGSGGNPGVNPGVNPKAPFVLQNVIADGAILRILPRDPDKDPLEFDLARLSLQSAAVDRPMTFRATLTNPKPPGVIESHGEFGPWNTPEPGATPLRGDYTFHNADLSVFNGISGTLSSDGSYKGQLARIECDGTTDTPDFAISTGGKPVDLKTKFHAIVDGLNGDTQLDPVNAEFLHSFLVARGVVEGLPEHRGKRIKMDVVVDHGRVEDFLRLVVKSSKPMIVGSAKFHTTFDLPPGKGAVIDRLILRGKFDISGARFTDLNIQEKIVGMSHRAQGDPDNLQGGQVTSKFIGSMVVADGIAAFPSLDFAIPGAELDLAGKFGLHNQELDFTGKVMADAQLSEMTTGWKSKALKFVDPFFRKEGHGTVIPLKITGTRSDPHFGFRFSSSQQRKPAIYHPRKPG
jgi:hypothetical protein